MKKVVLFVVLVVALIGAVVIVQASFQGCHCQFIGDCGFSESGKGYRYYFCGNCNAYSGWVRDLSCVKENATKTQ
jgi:hypothetical protein